MSDEPVVGPQRIEVVEPHRVDTVHVDWLVTGGKLNGVVNLTLATLNYTYSSSESGVLPDAVVATKLRMSTPFAEDLYNFLGKILGKATEEPSQPPPAPVGNPKLH